MGDLQKLIKLQGMDQGDVIELLYYLGTQQTSILNYMSALGRVCSAIFSELSDAETSVSLSLSGTVGQSFGITARAGFPGSMSDVTGVTISLT